MSSSALSYLLVFLQFLFIALLASPTRDFLTMTPLAMLGLTLLVAATALALWALISMRRGTFRVLPEPSDTAQLTRTGPYKSIRHPMYSAVLLAGLGAAIAHATLFHGLLLVCLTLVMYFKIKREEAALTARYPEYKEYRSQTKALFPFIY